MMNHKFLLSLVAMLFLSLHGFSQVNGCTDPQAINYNPDATVNDGSCLYPSTAVTPATVVNALPETIMETSALIYWSGGLWTLNDSGNEPELYKFDTLTGQISQTIAISGAQNVDWEDLAQDETRIFIGDFGNNLGNRTDLKIYVVEKSSIPASGNAEVLATEIEFSYGDQQSFKKANRNNDYDCESMLSAGDSLFLFTKNWVNEQSRIYVLPKEPGTYTVFPSDQFDTDGLITGADMIEGSGEVVLCGYKNYSPFIWLLFDFNHTDFFGGNKRRINFSGMLGTQTEGVAYTFGRNVYISSEKTSLSPPRLFRINTTPWVQPSSVGIENQHQGKKHDEQGLLVYPNPSNGSFWLNAGSFCDNGNYSADVFNCQGKKIVDQFPLTFSDCTAEVNLQLLSNGLYFLRCFSHDASASGWFLIAE